MPPYRIIRPLVERGRCSVFECEREDGRVFIVKQLSPNTGEVAAARFEREIRLATTISHPNIVKVIDVDPSPKPTWFVMPKYDCSLADRLKDIQGRPHVIDPIFTGLLRGVARLHWHAIVHRDLKPENVLVNLPQTAVASLTAALNGLDVVVADFGTSREIPSAARLTMSGQPLGTDFYMAPEVRAFGGSRADCRSDIFALGAILSALYTGLPFPERRELDDRPTPPFEILCLINKARSWIPERRYQTVPELQRTWRLAALPPIARSLAADGLERFGEQLHDDGAPSEDVSRVLTLVGRSSATSQHVYETTTQVKSTTMGIVARRHPLLARRLVWATIDHVETKGTAVPAAPLVVRSYQALSQDIDDAVCRGVLAAGLFTFGHRYNERSAIDSFNTLVSRAGDGPQRDTIRDALLDLDPALVSQAKRALEHEGLTETSCELFSSL